MRNARHDFLARLSVDFFDVTPQHFVAIDHVVQCPLQRCAVEIAFDSERCRDVVRGQIRIDFLQVPETALGKR